MKYNQHYWDLSEFLNGLKYNATHKNGEFNARDKEVTIKGIKYKFIFRFIAENKFSLQLIFNRQRNEFYTQIFMIPCEYEDWEKLLRLVNKHWDDIRKSVVNQDGTICWEREIRDELKEELK